MLKYAPSLLDAARLWAAIFLWEHYLSLVRKEHARTQLLPQDLYPPPLALHR